MSQYSLNVSNSDRMGEKWASTDVKLYGCYEDCYSDEVWNLALDLKRKAVVNGINYDTKDIFYIKCAQLIISRHSYNMFSNEMALLSNNPIDDPEWAQYSWEEILEMENSGCEIPDKVLLWAHGQEKQDVTEYVAVSDDSEKDKDGGDSDLNQVFSLAQQYLKTTEDTIEYVNAQMDSSKDITNQVAQSVEKEQNEANKKAKEIQEKSDKLDKLYSKSLNQKLDSIEQNQYEELSGEIVQLNKSVAKKDSFKDDNIDAFLKELEDINQSINQNEKLSDKTNDLGLQLSKKDTIYNRNNVIQYTNSYKSILKGDFTFNYSAQSDKDIVANEAVKKSQLLTDNIELSVAMLSAVQDIVTFNANENAQISYNQTNADELLLRNSDNDKNNLDVNTEENEPNLGEENGQQVDNLIKITDDKTIDINAKPNNTNNNELINNNSTNTENENNEVDLNTLLQQSTKDDLSNYDNNINNDQEIDKLAISEETNTVDNKSDNSNDIKANMDDNSLNVVQNSDEEKDKGNKNNDLENENNDNQNTKYPELKGLVGATASLLAKGIADRATTDLTTRTYELISNKESVENKEKKFKSLSENFKSKSQKVNSKITQNNLKTLEISNKISELNTDTENITDDTSQNEGIALSNEANNIINSSDNLITDFANDKKSVKSTISAGKKSAVGLKKSVDNIDSLLKNQLNVSNSATTIGTNTSVAGDIELALGITTIEIGKVALANPFTYAAGVTLIAAGKILSTIGSSWILAGGKAQESGISGKLNNAICSSLIEEANKSASNADSEAQGDTAKVSSVVTVSADDDVQEVKLSRFNQEGSIKSKKKTQRVNASSEIFSRRNR